MSLALITGAAKLLPLATKLGLVTKSSICFVIFLTGSLLATLLSKATSAGSILFFLAILSSINFAILAALSLTLLGKYFFKSFPPTGSTKPIPAPIPALTPTSPQDLTSPCLANCSIKLSPPNNAAFKNADVTGEAKAAEPK